MLRMKTAIYVCFVHIIHKSVWPQSGVRVMPLQLGLQTLHRTVMSKTVARTGNAQGDQPAPPPPPAGGVWVNGGWFRSPPMSPVN